MTYRSRHLALLLIIVFLVRGVHLDLSGIASAGMTYRLAGFSAPADTAYTAAQPDYSGVSFEYIDYTLVREACARELTNSSRTLTRAGSFLRSVRKESDISAAFRLFLATVLSFCLAATGFMRRCRRFCHPLPLGRLFFILHFIHQLDGKK